MSSNGSFTMYSDGSWSGPGGTKTFEVNQYGQLSVYRYLATFHGGISSEGLNYFYDPSTFYDDVTMSQGLNISSGGITVSGTSTINGNLTSDTLTLSSANTGSSGEGDQLRIRTNGTLIRITSSERYKDNIRPLEADFMALYDLRLTTHERKETGVTAHSFIAEEVAAAGLDYFVRYDKEGRINSVDNESLAAFGHHVLIQDLNRRLKALEEKHVQSA